MERQDFVNWLADILAQHREGVVSVFSQFGIAQEPTPELMVLAYKKHGDKFVNALNGLSLGYDGTPELVHLTGETTATTEKKKWDWGKILDTITGIATGTIGVIGAVRKPTATTDGEPPVKDKILGIPKTIFIMLAVVLVLIGGYYAASKNSK